LPSYGNYSPFKQGQIEEILINHNSTNTKMQHKI